MPCRLVAADILFHSRESRLSVYLLAIDCKEDLHGKQFKERIDGRQHFRLLMCRKGELFITFSFIVGWLPFYGVISLSSVVYCGVRRVLYGRSWRLGLGGSSVAFFGGSFPLLSSGLFGGKGMA